MNATAFMTVTTLCSFASLSAASNELTLTVWPIQTTITAPISTVLSSLPDVGTVVQPTIVTFDALALFNRYVQTLLTETPVTTTDLITFDASTIRAQTTPLFEEVAFREMLSPRFPPDGLSSPAAVHDPLQPELRSPQSTRVLDSVLQSVIPAFYNAEMANLRSTFTRESSGYATVRTLDDIILDTIDEPKVRILAGFLGVDPDLYKRVAARVLRDHIRAQNGIIVASVRNPYALYQSVSILDPILFSSGEFNGLISDFAAYKEDLCLKLLDYWEQVYLKSLISESDMRTLVEFKIAADSHTLPFIAANDSTPGEAVADRCLAADPAMDRFSRNWQIIYQMAHRYIKMSFDNQHLPSDPGRYLASYALSELDMDVSDAPDYAGHFPLIAMLASQTYPMFGIDAPSAIPSGAALKDWISRWTAQTIADQISTEFLSVSVTVLGDVTVKLPGHSHDVLQQLAEAEDPFPTPDLPNPARGGEILSEFYDARGRNTEYYLEQLRDWRADITVLDSIDGPPPRQRRFDEFWLRFYRVIMDYARQEANARELRLSLEGVLKVNELLGFSDTNPHDTGRIRVPADATVMSVAVSRGEFVRQGTNILTVESLYGRKGRAKVSTAEMAGLGAEVGDVFELSVAGHDIEPPLTLTAELVSISFRTDGFWDLDFLVQVSVRVDAITALHDISGLPRVIPFSGWLCQLDDSIFSDDLCLQANALLGRYADVRVQLNELH